MKRNQRYAFNALKKLGAPVFERSDLDEHGTFGISAESNYEEIWADYWEVAYLDNNCGYVFGVNPKIIKTLKKYGLYAEWDNPGSLSVWES